MEHESSKKSREFLNILKNQLEPMNTEVLSFSENITIGGMEVLSKIRIKNGYGSALYLFVVDKDEKLVATVLSEISLSHNLKPW